MLGSLLAEGVEIVNDPTQADAIIVNTCSFIDAAQEESVDAILESANFRAQRQPGQAVIVSGCLPQRFRDDLPKLFPEVDAFMGIDQVEGVGGIVHQAISARAQKLVEESLASAAPAGARSAKNRNRSAAGAKSAKAQVQSELAQLDLAKGAKDHETEASLRGTPAFGRTKQMLNAPGGGGSPSARPSPAPSPADAVAPVQVHLRPNYVPHWDTPRFRLTPKHFAYVKIAEGCNHPCSFCIIPRMRGSHRSRGQADVVEEARRLLASGVKELNLISQDSTYYGLDLRPNASRAIASPDRFTAATRALPEDATTLCTLLRALNALPGRFWIRLLYTHPAHWTEDLITTLAECPKVARYVDMPLQHIHDDMLARMRRETSGQYIRDLIARIRAGVPGIALRTTFIVGFPGETAAHFDTLVEFIRETRFERLGIFAYSQEDGTIAGKMAGQVPPKTRQKRRELAMAAQHAVAREVSASFVGRTLKVLVEGEATAKSLLQARVASWEHGLIREAGEGANQGDRGTIPDGLRLRTTYSVARGEADAPDIDGRIYVQGRLPVGAFAQVRVIGHTDYDLIAKPVA